MGSIYRASLRSSRQSTSLFFNQLNSKSNRDPLWVGAERFGSDSRQISTKPILSQKLKTFSIFSNRTPIQLLMERGILCCRVDVTSKKKQNEMRNDPLEEMDLEGVSLSNCCLLVCFFDSVSVEEDTEGERTKKCKEELHKWFDETHDQFGFVFELLVIGIVFEFERLQDKVDVKTGLLLKKLQKQLKEQKEEDGRIWYALLQKEDKTK